MEAHNQQKIYQTTGLSPDIVDKMVVDDSPTVLFDEFWPFLGVDIPVANIEPADFKIILLQVRRQILNILERYPENKWDKIKIVEWELQAATDKNGNVIMKTIGEGENKRQEPVYVKKPKMVYYLVELLNSMDAKVFGKLCRARGGFTLNALTVERSHAKQDVNDSRPVVMPVQPANQAQESDGGWGL
jgi:hypothetical protein